MRTLIVVVSVLFGLSLSGCSTAADKPSPYGAQAARIGESLSVLGWNMSVANLRWDADHVLVDVDASPSDPGAPHAAVEDIRFGLYGSLGHPLEVTGVHSCDDVMVLGLQSLAATAPDRLTGTVCLGPWKNQAAVRGVYVYSPADRIAGSTVAYPAAYPVGVQPTDGSDTGLALSNTGVTVWRTDGTLLTPADLGDEAAFSGDGYMMIGLTADAGATGYRDDALARGGPLMVVAGPAQPLPGADVACTAAGSSALVLPDALLDAVHLDVTLCTRGELTAAALYASVSVIGTHAAVWTEP